MKRKLFQRSRVPRTQIEAVSHICIYQQLYNRYYLVGSDEALGNGKHGGNGEDLIAAVVLAGGDQHLGELGIQGELGHDGAQLRQVPVIVQRRQVVQQLQRSHQRLQQ